MLLTGFWRFVWNLPIDSFKIGNMKHLEISQDFDPDKELYRSWQSLFIRIYLSEFIQILEEFFSTKIFTVLAQDQSLGILKVYNRKTSNKTKSTSWGGLKRPYKKFTLKTFNNKVPFKLSFLLIVLRLSVQLDWIGNRFFWPTLNSFVSVTNLNELRSM